MITGPTASGKSSMAIKLAKEYSGEIISADSRQVYKRMNLGTGKIKTEPIENPDKTEQRLGKCLSDGVVHYLLDVVDPRKETFNMAKFQRLAQQAVELILKEGKRPFLVGGTMLYIDAFTKGFLPPAGRDREIRSRLERLDTPKLAAKLKQIDPQASWQIDRANRYRLIRALEVREQTKKSFFDSQKRRLPGFKNLKLVLNPFSRKRLYRMIDERVDQRIEQGMIEEVKDLHRWGLSWQKLEQFGLEYRYISRYLRGQLRKEKMIEILKNKTHGYGRRQLSWWRQDREAVWIKNFAQARAMIDKFLDNACKS